MSLLYIRNKNKLDARKFLCLLEMIKLKKNIHLRLVWEQFLKNETDVLHDLMSEDIKLSWYYSKENKVNPYDGKAVNVLTPEKLKKRQKENEFLLSLSAPYIEQLASLLKGWRYITTITDKDGYILAENGERTVQKEAQKILFSEGSKWIEEEIGTNAIGIALRLEKSISVMGYEHFAKASQNWNCSAAPIFNHRDELVGVFNVSSVYRSINYDYILACVQLIANSISLAWKEQMQTDMRYLQEAYKSCKDNTVVSLYDGTICSMSSNLYANYREFIAESIETMLQHTNMMFVKQPVPIQEKERIIGYVYTLSPIQEDPTLEFKGITGTSTVYKEILHEVKMVAPRSTSVHLHGETGVGKEVLARTIHQNSKYSSGPFQTINCGALPDNLLESELFGYESGAFTGANRRGYIGKIEQANGGTLFLDEIDAMPLAMQVALLRVLQEHRLTRIGGKEEISLHFRLITASNKDIRTMVQEGAFREDLFYRIYVFPIYIAPLRERKKDIKYFIRHYLKQQQWFPSWQDRLEEVFIEGDWYGNVRELFNALERCDVLYRHTSPTNEQLRHLLSVLKPNHFKETQEQWSLTEKIERDKIINLLEEHDGNVMKVAKLLSISRATIYRRMKKYKI